MTRKLPARRRAECWIAWQTPHSKLTENQTITRAYAPPPWVNVWWEEDETDEEIEKKLQLVRKASKRK